MSCKDQFFNAFGPDLLKLPLPPSILVFRRSFLLSVKHLLFNASGHLQFSVYMNSNLCVNLDHPIDEMRERHRIRRLKSQHDTLPPKLAKIANIPQEKHDLYQYAVLKIVKELPLMHQNGLRCDTTKGYIQIRVKVIYLHELQALAKWEGFKDILLKVIPGKAWIELFFLLKNF